MPLNADDVRTISPAATELVQAIVAATRLDSPGERRVTPEEGKTILRLVGKLLIVLITDLID